MVYEVARKISRSALDSKYLVEEPYMVAFPSEEEYFQFKGSIQHKVNSVKNMFYLKIILFYQLSIFRKKYVMNNYN